MEIGKTRLALSASMLALALALAGCGGGGSGGTTTAPPTGPVDPGNTGNMNGDGDMDGDDDVDTPTLTATQQAVVDAKAALDAADMSDANYAALQVDYLDAAYAELMEARNAVEKLEDDASDEDQQAALLRERNAEMAYEEAWELDGNESDRAMAKLRAEGINGILLTPTERTDAFTVDARELTEVSEDMVKFVPSTTHASVWIRTLEDESRQWVVPRTDKEADRDAKFSEWYASEAPSGSVTGDDDAGFNWKTRAGAITVDDAGVITIASNADADTLKLFAFDFAMNEDDGDDMKFTGSFHGIPGELTCTGECVPVFDAMGMLTNLGSTDWTFTPTEEDAMKLAMLPVADVKEDAEYLDFGTWGTTVDTDDGQTRKYGAYAQAMGPTPSLGGLTGDAKYEGTAYGTYAKKMENPKGMLEPTSHGGFWAIAELTAKFGGGDIPANDHNSITGTISGFMDGSSVIDKDWMVTLEKGTIEPGGGITAGVTKATGKDGDWAGAFLGGSDTGQATDHVMPSAVTGTFDAHFTNGHVVGAFGAYEQKPAE